MALTQRLEFRQSQALVMTPQLMQAIKLLQLSNLDLTAYVDEELERNPLLERTGEAGHEGDGPGASGMPAPEGRSDVADGAFDAARVSSSSRSGGDEISHYSLGTSSEWAGARGASAEDNNLEAWVSTQMTL